MKRFDFIIAQSIFSHASQSQIQKCLSQSHAVLKEHGILIATFLLGVKDNTESGWVYPDCVKYTCSTVSRMIRGQGLKFIRTQWPHPFDQTWYVIFHPENEMHVRDKLRSTAKIYAQNPGLKNTLARYTFFNNRLTRYLRHLARILFLQS